MIDTTRSDTSASAWTLEAEVARLRAGLEKIRAEYDQRTSWVNGTSHPTDYAKAWSDGYGTALAHCSLIAFEHLDPAGWDAHEEHQRLTSQSSDREFFEKTGRCGHCGNPAAYCTCTAVDPCACGPHELATEPLPCRWCNGTGIGLLPVEAAR